MDVLARAGAVVTCLPLAVLLPVRVLGGALGHPWPMLVTVLPWSVLLCGVGACLAAVVRWRAGGVVIGLLTLGGVLLLAPRLAPGPSPDVAPQGPVLTIAVANLRTGAADPAAVVEAVDSHGVDVLVTLELTQDAIDGLVSAGLERHLPHAVLEPSRLTSGGGVHSRTGLDPLPSSGARGFGRTPRATVRLDDGTSLTVEAVHPLPPISAEWTRRWREALGTLGEPHGDGRRILVGDFNATHDHAPFRVLLARGWVDAADAVGAGLVPTFNALPWGEPVPPVTLDHVLVGASTAVQQVHVTPLPDSDHRMLVVRVRLPAG